MKTFVFKYNGQKNWSSSSPLRVYGIYTVKAINEEIAENIALSYLYRMEYGFIGLSLMVYD